MGSPPKFYDDPDILFGTGYSSLAYLRKFRVDVLKIDRSFVEGIATSHESAAVVHTLVELGKTLNIETLAEGIEDSAQLQTLRRECCDHGQGFLFSRPLQAEALEVFLGEFESSRVFRSADVARLDRPPGPPSRRIEVKALSGSAQ